MMAGVAAGHRKARHHQELARRLAGRVVHAEHRLAGEQLEEAVLEHAPRAGLAFFGRLEHQVQVAVEIARRRQVARRRQQHRGVAVVAAGVHRAQHLAGPGLAAGLGDRQRVHVGAQADVPARRAQAQRADHAGAAQAAVHLVAPALQPLGHQVGGGMLLIGHLRVGMDLAADLAPSRPRGRGSRPGRAGARVHSSAGFRRRVVRAARARFSAQCPRGCACGLCAARRDTSCLQEPTDEPRPLETLAVLDRPRRHLHRHRRPRARRRAAHAEAAEREPASSTPTRRSRACAACSAWRRRADHAGAGGLREDGHHGGHQRAARAQGRAARCWSRRAAFATRCASPTRPGRGCSTATSCCPSCCTSAWSRPTSASVRRRGGAGRWTRPRCAASCRRPSTAGMRACAIVFMHGYRYSAHEAAAAALARDIGFTQVSVSHEVSPLMKLVVARRHHGGRCLPVADPAALCRAGGGADARACGCSSCSPPAG